MFGNCLFLTRADLSCLVLSYSIYCSCLSVLRSFSSKCFVQTVCHWAAVEFLLRLSSSLLFNLIKVTNECQNQTSLSSFSLPRADDVVPAGQKKLQ